jgi:hypothetical protein
MERSFSMASLVESDGARISCSSTAKNITKHCEGFVQQPVEMASCSVIHIRSFMKIGPGTRKWQVRVHTQTPRLSRKCHK